MKKLILIITLPIIVFSCGKTKSTNTENLVKDESKKTEVVSDQLKQLDDIVYQIPETKKPVVLFFDAQAAGTQFINQYGEMFNSMNIGVVASNFYRNGISGEEAGEVLQQMMETARNQGADMEQIYLMGFSGGAKFAQNLSIMLPHVKAVITMGMAKNHMHREKVPEINIIGVDDMNFSAVMQYPLKGNYEKPDLVILHGGGHEWAPIEIVKYVFQYCESGFQSDKVQLPAQQDTYVNTLNIALNRFEVKQKPEALGRLKKLLGSTFQSEQQWLAKFQSLFENGQIKSWTDMLYKLDAEEKDLHIKARVRGYLSMVNYILSSKYIEQGNIEKSNVQLEIYKIVDPENPDIQLLSALQLSKQGKYDEAVKAVSDAIEKGNTGYQKLYYMKFPQELIKREDFVLTLNQIYPN